MTNLFFSCKNGVAMIYTSWIGLLIWLFGGIDLLVNSLLVLMFLDFLSGMIVGYKNNELNSKRAGKGIKKKVMTLFIFMCSVIISRVTGRLETRTLVAMFYISVEVLSIVENASKCGVPVPRILKRALEQCRDGSCDEKGCKIKKDQD